MAQPPPKTAQKETPVEPTSDMINKRAEKAAEALQSYIITGNTQSRDAFNSLWKENNQNDVFFNNFISIINAKSGPLIKSVSEALISGPAVANKPAAREIGVDFPIVISAIQAYYEEMGKPTAQRDRAKLVKAYGDQFVSLMDGIRVHASMSVPIIPLKSKPEAISPEMRKIKQDASDAAISLRDFLLTSDSASLEKFKRIYDENESEGFMKEFAIQFRIRIGESKDLGQLVSAYGKEKAQSAPSEFAGFVADVYSAADAGGLDTLKELAEGFGDQGKKVVDMLVGIRIAGLFKTYLETKDNDKRSKLRKDLRSRFLLFTNMDGIPTADFMSAFIAALGDQAMIFTSYASSLKVKDLSGGQLADLVDKLAGLLAQLRSPGYDRIALERVYGKDMVAAVLPAVVKSTAPALEITAEGLRKRVDGIREWLAERKIEGLDEQLDKWDESLRGPPTRQQLIALNSAIPSREMLEDLDGTISKRSKKITSIIDGGNAFYETIGGKIWVPRLESTVSGLKSLREDALLKPFALALMERYGIDLDALGRLLDSAKIALTDVPPALVTLEQTMRSSTTQNEQSRLDSVNLLLGPGGLVDKQIDNLTNRIAVFFPGVVREEKGKITVVDREKWDAIRSNVAKRFMSPFVVDGPGDPVARLRSEYVAMAKDPGYLTFVNTFTGDIDRYNSSLSSASPTTDAERFTVSSRRDIGTKARTLFPSLPMQYTYAVYAMLRDTYGEGWQTALTDTEAMAKVCALVMGLADLPPAYGAFVIKRTGSRLMKNYDDASIAVIGKAIVGYSQPFIQGDFYYMLQHRYYERLDDKMLKLFADITAVQKDRREPTKDVRIRTPDEDPSFTSLYVPSAQIFVRVPKRVYEQFTASSMLNIVRAPDLTRSPTYSPDFLRVMTTAIEKPMVEGKVALPIPFIRLPLVLQNIGALAPDFLPPVGDYIATQISGDSTLHHYTKDKTSSTDFSVNLAQNFVREGAVTTGKQSYTLTEGTGKDTEHKGSIDIQNLRVAEGYNVSAFNANFDIVGDRMQTVAGLFSGLAPRGADTLAYFKVNEPPDVTNPDGTVTKGDRTVTAYIFQRLPNGSFVEVDTVTLPKDVAETLYHKSFEKPMQRLYGAGRLQVGDFMAQIDGAVLFAGPMGAGMEWQQGQGAGLAIQAREWGGYTDYEATRGTRAAGAFGRFMASDRSFWVGRLTADNIRTDDTGKRKYYAEGMYLAAERTEVRGFLGLAEDPSWGTTTGALVMNHMFKTSFLGMRSWGLGGGRLVRDFYGGGREELAGGKIYGVDSTLINGFVASALFRSYTPPTAAGTTTGPGSLINIPPISQDAGKTSIDNQVNRDHPELNQQPSVPQDKTTQMLISAGTRFWLPHSLRIETGAGWDTMNNKGGGFFDFDWVPSGEHISDLGLRAFLFTTEKAVSSTQRTAHGDVALVGLGQTTQMEIMPVVGGMADLIARPGVRLIAEAYYPGVGEFRLRMPSFEMAIGGGNIPNISGGGHFAMRIPITHRLIFGVMGSGSTDTLGQEARTLYNAEGIAGLVYTMPVSSRPGLRLGSVWGAASGIYQQEQVFEAERGRAFQLDLTGGMNWLTASSTLSGKLGIQHWQTAWPTERGSRTGVNLGLDYRARTLRWGGDILINPGISLNLGLGRTDLEGAGTKTTQTDFKLNFMIGAQY